MPRDIVSEQQINMEFVKEIQKHPTLYNFELPTYSRKDVTDKAWEEVGRAMKMTPSACRERWRNLRAVFMRTIKAPPTRTGKKKPYYLADVMQFVVPFMRPLAVAEAKEKQKKLRAIEAQQNENDNSIEIEVQQIKIENDYDPDELCIQSFKEESEPYETNKRPAKDDELRQSKKLAKLGQASSSVATGSTDTEHVKSFLNSLVPELTEMNSAQFKNFKRRVLLLIDDITADVPASKRDSDDSDSEYIM